MLKPEEFSAMVLWSEHVRLSAHISDFERRKHFRKTLNKIRREDLGLKPGTMWAEMVTRWYREYRIKSAVTRTDIEGGTGVREAQSGRDGLQSHGLRDMSIGGTAK